MHRMRKKRYAVTPENVALYAQGSSENSFFQLFDAAKDQAKVEEADGTTTYTLAGTVHGGWTGWQDHHSICKRKLVGLLLYLYV